MRTDLLFALLHALVLWVVLRLLAGLAVSAGAQSLWGLAGAVAGAVLVSSLLLAWFTGTARLGAGRRVRRLLPAPLVGAAVTVATASLNGATVAQAVVGGLAWVSGAVGALLVLVLLAQRLGRAGSEMSSTLGWSGTEPVR